mgnify:CR=1 FL=1
MKFLLKSLALLIALSLLYVTPPAGAADGGVTSTLKSSRIVRAGDGTEKHLPAERASAGDVVEYLLVYKNTSRGPIKNLLATLPVPSGMTLVEKSANPPTATFSADGKAYSEAPVHRKVTDAAGHPRREMVPQAEIRFLRWMVTKLGPGESCTLTARVRVNGPTH